jgi:hypothetical protein
VISKKDCKGTAVCTGRRWGMCTKPREKIRTANFGAGGRSSAGHATSDGMTLHTYLQTKCSISVSERCSKSYTTLKKAFAIKLM